VFWHKCVVLLQLKTKNRSIMKEYASISIESLRGLVSSDYAFRNLAEFASDLALEVMSVQTF